MHFLGAANIQSGQTVLIIGAGGSIGTFGVQLAKSLGAEVTAIDDSRKLGMLRSIGADHVLDYTASDFTTNGEIYDVILDVVGKGSVSRGLRSLKDPGFYLLANPRVSEIIRGRWASRGSNKTFFFGTSSGRAEDLMRLKGLVEAGKLRTVIDRSYPIEQTAEAHVYAESGQKTGNVVITVGPTDGADT